MKNFTRNGIGSILAGIVCLGSSLFATENDRVPNYRHAKRTNTENTFHKDHLQSANWKDAKATVRPTDEELKGDSANDDLGNDFFYSEMNEKEMLEVMIAEEEAALEAQAKQEGKEPLQIVVEQEAEDHKISDEPIDPDQPENAKEAKTKPVKTAVVKEEAKSKEEMDKELEDLFREEYGTGKDLGPYRLRIGDRLFLSIYGEGNTGRMVLVDQTGRINYLLIGDVFVLGKTIDELRLTLNKSIKKYYKQAFITITPVEFGSQSITILGEVKAPGKKIIFGRTTLLMALAEAGGFSEGLYRSQTIELADLSHAFLARDGDYIPVDFKKLVVEGDLTEDVELANGDYIYIPNSLYREVIVLGEVKAPTTFGYINTVSLVEAIATARGLTERASSRVLVIRGSLSNPKTFLIDINLILRGFEPDFLLQPGDIVFAPVRKFQNLREVLQLGIRAYVSNIASIGGARFYDYLDPNAANTTVNPIFPIQPLAPTPFP